MRKYEHRRGDGWTRPESLRAVQRYAARKLVTGRGPFTVVVDGEKPSEGLRRVKALRRLRRELADVRFGTIVRVRGKKRVLVTARAIKVEDVSAKRKAMCDDARWMAAHRDSIHYSQDRPIPQYSEHHLPMTLDCSGAVVTLAHWNGVPSPTGSYSGGSTDTILAHLHAIPMSEAQPGDLALWHYGSDGKHVAMILEHGGNPTVFSHGSESGPLLLSLSAEDSYHRNETLTILRSDV